MFFKFGIIFRKNSTIYKGNKKIKCFKRIGLKVFNKTRNLIYKYLLREYQTDLLGELNQDGYFFVDESLFGHGKEWQIWILGIINNTTMDFRLEGAYTRDSSTLDKFIKKMVTISLRTVWGVMIFKIWIILNTEGLSKYIEEVI